MVEGLGVILLIAVVVAPVALHLGAVVVGALLRQVGALLELRLRLRVAAHVGQRLGIEGAGQRRVGGRLDGGGTVSGRTLDVVVPVLDPRQDGEDEAVVGGELLSVYRLIERRLLLGLIVEDERVGRVVFGVLGMGLDQVLQLAGGRRIFVLV